MAWTYEVHELSEGFSAIVYDEHGRRIADHLTEEQAQLIAAAHDLLEAAQDVLAWMYRLPIPTRGCTAKCKVLYDAIAKAGGAS